jgi:hypothetical protein
MNFPYFSRLASTAVFASLAASAAEVSHWPLDNYKTEHWSLPHGQVHSAPGAKGESLRLDGESVIELKDSTALASGSFTLSLWFNPYDLSGGQQILAGKNRYSRGERQWSLTIEPDGKLKAHLWQTGWVTIPCPHPLQPGAWHRATLSVSADKAILYLNGQPVGETGLKSPIAPTDSPITLGGIWDAGHVRQPFTGAVDDCVIHAVARSQEEIAKEYEPSAVTHDIPKPASLAPLWDASKSLPNAEHLPQVEGASFHVIKPQRPDVDACKWTLGVGLEWHKGKLYASYGFNTGEENTPTEEAHVRVSEDGGKTWSKPLVMDAGEGNLGVSHGVFLSHAGSLWAFMGAFHGKFVGTTHTRAYRLDEQTQRWSPVGTVLENGFWPMQQPQKMADGNWIMAGLHVAHAFGKAGNPPTVAISKGDDFTQWEQVIIPTAPNLGSNIWGESTVIIDGKRLLNISRYGKKPLALLSVSEDFGRTWSAATASNLPMATSKPYAGTLSTGQRYLVCTNTANTGGARTPLTIAVSKPGSPLFSKVFLIRTSEFAGTPGVSAPKADFSYPYAVEHAGMLYVGYTHKSHAANELAIIPVKSLTIAP